MNQGSDGQPKKIQRSRYASQKFFNSKDDIKASHPHIVEWFDGCKSREIKSEIINNCFQKVEGQWKLNPLGPFFKESKQRCVCENHGGLYSVETSELQKVSDFRSFTNCFNFKCHSMSHTCNIENVFFNTIES